MDKYKINETDSFEIALPKMNVKSIHIIFKYLCKVLSIEDLKNMDSEILKLRKEIKKAVKLQNGVPLGVIDKEGNYNPINLAGLKQKQKEEKSDEKKDS